MARDPSAHFNRVALCWVGGLVAGGALLYILSSAHPLTWMLGSDVSLGVLPLEVGFYGPDTLWAAAVGVAIAALLRGAPPVLIVLVAGLGGVSHELGQWLHIVPGTPCPVDLIASAAAGLLAGGLTTHFALSELRKRKS